MLRQVPEAVADEARKEFDGVDLEDGPRNVIAWLENWAAEIGKALEIGDSVKVISTNAQIFVDGIDYPVVWFTSVGSPAGQTINLLESTTLPFDLAEINGTVKDGEFEAILTDETDCNRNSVTRLTITNDEAGWKSALCEYATCEGESRPAELYPFLREHLTDAEIAEHLGEFLRERAECYFCETKAEDYTGEREWNFDPVELDWVCPECCRAGQAQV